VPVPGTWNVDPSHTTVGFSARHLGLTKVRGRFTDVTGSVVIAERPEDSHVEVAIATTSVDTGDARRDEHLRSDDFFGSAEHPAMAYRSTAVRRSGDGWKLDGELTIKGVTKPVTLDLEFEGAGPDPWGGTRASFAATTEIDREAWGLTWNAALETGNFLVGKKVKLELDVQLVQQ
jgi:polyisoprenoid-binding protein YceI